jgi:hypothetical protein
MHSFKLLDVIPELPLWTGKKGYFGVYSGGSAEPSHQRNWKIAQHSSNLPGIFTPVVTRPHRNVEKCKVTNRL